MFFEEDLFQSVLKVAMMEGMLSFSLAFIGASLFLFFIGAAVGSFLNVLVSRSLRDEQWSQGRSHCDHCGKKIPWYDLVPLFSFAVLRGKTRCCKKDLSISHPVVEFLTGTLFVWWYWGGTLFFQLTQSPFQTLQPLFWLAVGVILVAIVIADLSYYLIPDTAVGLLFVITICYRLILTATGVMRASDLLASLLAMVGVVAFFWALWYITRGKGMGFGDVKLVAPLSLLLGWPKIVVALFSAFCIGALVGLVLVVAKRRKMQQPIPFGPFLILGSWIGLVFGNQLLAWYLSYL